MPSTHSKRVASRFAAQAGAYERHADLQQEIARTLAAQLPSQGIANVLEVGCGTGFLTRSLVERFPDAELLVSDLVPEMVEQCQASLAGMGEGRVRFAVLNGEEPGAIGPFDLIALSMTAQWFAEPDKGLRRLAGLLNPSGSLHYATIAPGGFSEWRRALRETGLQGGLIEMPELPGVALVETRAVEYADAVSFLKGLKAIGAATPRPGYRPLPPGSLRRALKAMQDVDGGTVTWRIAYGRLGPEDAIRP